jgi:hypothetical protein
MRFVRSVGAIASLLAAIVVVAPAEAQSSVYWSEAKAERYMESYPNVLRANCNGLGRRIGRRYNRFGCGLVYTDVSVGTAAMRVTSGRRAFVKFFS